MKQSEKNFQQTVIHWAQTFGWRVAYFRPARVLRHGEETYETPVGADGKGFPDLMLCRRGRLLFAELKSETGTVSLAQQEWLDALNLTGRCEVYVWRPRDWDFIVATLR